MTGLFGIGRRGSGTLSNDARQVRQHAARRRGARPAAGLKPATRMEPLENRLMMSAVRPDAAFATTDFRRGDDLSTTTVGGLPLNFTINFYGADYSNLYINNNGNVSFGSRNSTLIDAPFDAISSVMIAPFYADVDTRGTVGSSVRWGRGTVDGHTAFGVNWVNVNFHDALVPHTSGTNSFQLVLIDRSDLGAGNFDIEFNYDRILWESGMVQNGGSADGRGGSTARAGFSAGTGMDGQWFEMLGSGVAGSFLDGSPNGLIYGSYNSPVAGRYVYTFRDGLWTDQPDTGGENTPPMLTLPNDQYLVEGADGSTTMSVTGIFDDPDASDFWDVRADYGDGSGLQSLLYTQSKMFALNHTYANAGTYFVTVTVDDGNGGAASGVMRVDVQDLSSPVLEVSDPASASEGQWVTLYASTANDPDLNDTHSFEWVADGLAGAASADGRSFTFMADDSGTYSVRTTVRDQWGNATTVDTAVEVANVAPTASGLSGAATADEGGVVTFSLNGGSDVSAADLAAGLTYSFDLDGDGVYEVSGPTNAAARLFDDNGTYTVHARVSDKDGGHADYAMTVNVRNLAPVSAGMSGGGTINEGGEVTLSIAPAYDAAADLAAGLTYSFDFDGDGVYEVSGTSPCATHRYDDNGSHTVSGRVSDKDGGVADFQTTVVVKNVAPAAASGLSVAGELKEGSVLAFSLGTASDPSGADTAAGLTYSFDFNGDGVYDVTGTSPNASHVYDDNGMYTVRARVSDKDGGHSDYSTQLKIKNVPPKARSFTDNNPVAEGSAVTLSFNDASDPSGADTTAGFTYSFDFNNDGAYDVVSSSPTANHTFPNEGTYVVAGRVTDKDGDFTDYTTDVEVLNVAPTVSAFSTSASVLGNASAGSTVTVSGRFADAGVLDRHTAVIDWGDGTTSAASVSQANGAGTLSASHVYATGGAYNVTLRLADNAAPAGVASAASQAIVTGVGLHDGVLHVVGTNGGDRVTLMRDKNAIRVKSDLTKRDPEFSMAAVNEVRVLLGAGSDRFDIHGSLTQPVYVNGTLYSSGQQSTMLSRLMRLFSDIPVAA